MPPSRLAPLADAVLLSEMSSMPMRCAICAVIGLPLRPSSAADAADSAA